MSQYCCNRMALNVDDDVDKYSVYSIQSDLEQCLSSFASGLERLRSYVLRNRCDASVQTDNFLAACSTCTARNEIKLVSHYCQATMDYVNKGGETVSSSSSSSSCNPLNDQQKSESSDALERKNRARNVAQAFNSNNYVGTNYSSYFGGSYENGTDQLLYDERTCSIYDQQLGAYYFPLQGLYFDPRFSAYYVFDKTTRAFVFHSQPGRGPTISGIDGDYELVQSAEDVHRLNAMRQENEDVSSNYPPSLRLIVLTGQVVRGTLFIVPYTGALIGSGNDSRCDIALGDDVAPLHAHIQYTGEEYHVTSCLLDGGVWVDDRAVGQSSLALSHDCKLRLGKLTEILVHQHPGSSTCARCEPSFYYKSAPELGISPTSLSAKAIKRRYGLLSGSNALDGFQAVAGKYKDRAKLRRTLHGTGAFTLKPKLVSGIGKKMVLRMGWRVGQGLGKHNQGITEPISVLSNRKRAGLLLSSSEVHNTETDT